MQTSSAILSPGFKDKKVYAFTLRNKNHTEVIISNYGALILSFTVKQPDGSFNDIVLGFDNPHDYISENYLNNYSFFGAVVGRYSNRIKNGRITIDDKTYQLPVNKGTEHIHGGIEGFDKKVWDVVSFDEEKNTLDLALKSPDGEEGYPGNLDVSLKFQLTDDDELSHEFSAVTDQATAVNLTHHGYFNLNNGKGDIADHYIKIYASNILEQDSNYTTTGKYIPVENTKYDLKTFHQIAEKWGNEKEYDQSFVIDKKEKELALAAEVYSEKSKIKLSVLTTEPVVHLYTGTWIAQLKGKQDITYDRSSGFCLETQIHPNAINIPEFPNSVLRPGETYYHKTVYRIAHS